MTTVAEIMSKNVVTVPLKKGLREVIRIMAGSKISSVVITDNDKIVGILTERDLIKKILLPGKAVGRANLEEIMTKDPISVNSHTDLSEASNMMNEKKIRHLPIVDNGKLAGLVTQTDIVKETHKLHEKNVRFMTYQNVQTFIIIIFFLFLVAYLLYRSFGS